MIVLKLNSERSRSNDDVESSLKFLSIVKLIASNQLEINPDEFIGGKNANLIEVIVFRA